MMHQTRIPNTEYRIPKCKATNTDSASRVTRHTSRLFIAIALIALFACSSGWAQTASKKAIPLDKRVADLEAEVGRLRQEVNMYTLDGLPDNLILCDKRVPIFREDVRERFEREFFQLLENKGLLTIVIRRYFKYLNFITEETKRMAVPSDLIYLVITESYLNPRALSKANAAGLWQFIKETGKKEGLFVNDYIDERYNVRKATRSALSHLKGLYGEFGDWLIVMAAYNAGAGRLREVIENQETREFFEMYLPEETERYILRVMAIKEIILNRERYGLNVDEKELYKPVAISEVTLEAAREVHVSTFAKCMEVPYRIFRENNLHLRKYRLPKGTYQINVPSEKYTLFLRKLKDYPYISVVKE